MRKLTKQEQAMLKNLIQEGGFILDNKQYVLDIVELPAPSAKSVTSHSDLENRKHTMLKGERKFSIDDVIEMMDAGAL